MDSREYTEIFREFLPKISKYLAYRVHQNDVEDLASRVFEIAWKKRSSCPVGQELPWLFKIAGFVVSNHRRKVSAISLSLYDTDSASPSAETLVIADITFSKAWDKLTPKSRTVLALAAFDGLTITEISKALGISKNAASIRIHRARVSFDLILKELNG